MCKIEQIKSLIAHILTIENNQALTTNPSLIADNASTLNIKRNKIREIEASMNEDEKLDYQIFKLSQEIKSKDYRNKADELLLDAAKVDQLQMIKKKRFIASIEDNDPFELEDCGEGDYYRERNNRD